MRRRRRFLTMIVNGYTGRTQAVIEHRYSAPVSAFSSSRAGASIEACKL